MKTNQIIQGNCLDILKEIPDNSIDAVITDPPYMISSTVKIRRQRNPVKFGDKKSIDRDSKMAMGLRQRDWLHKRKGYKDYKYKGKDISFEFGEWDIFPDLNSYLEFSKKWFLECIRVLKKGGHILTFWDKHKLTYLADWSRELNVKPRQCLWWIKSNPVPCLSKDSMILSNTGLDTIQDYNSNLIDIKGNFVHGLKTRRPYNNNLIIINTYGNQFPLKLTPEHQLYCLKIFHCSLPSFSYKKCLPKFKDNICPYSPKKGYKCKRFCENYKLEWIKADQISPGDYLVYPRNYKLNNNSIEIKYFTRGNHIKKEKEKIILNKDIMRLIGFYLAEGSILGKTNAIRFYFSLREEHYCQEIKDIIMKYFNYKAKIIKHEWKYEVRAENSKLKSFLEISGSRLAYEKRIHPIIFSQSKELLFELIKSYWQGDGCIVNSKGEFIDFSTTSPYLAGQIFLILIKLGYCPAIRKYKYNDKGKIKGKHPIYRISLRGKEQVKNFLQFKIVTKAFYHRFFIDEKYIYVPVRTIKKEFYKGCVYDYISNGSFLTINGIVHNCARKVNFMSAVECIYWGCLTPDHCILTEDLRWVPVGDLKKGDNLIAFTENCNKKGYRHFCRSKVLSNKLIKKDCYELYLSDGTIITASEDHPFLRKSIRGKAWITPKEIQSWWANKKYLKGKIHFDRILPVWKTNNSYVSGYIAGMMDGEGSLGQRTFIHNSYKHHSIKLEIAQNKNEAFKNIIKYLKLLGFNYKVYKSNSTQHIWINGNLGQILKCLGIIRPPRLLAKFNPDLLGILRFRKENKNYLKDIKYIGKKIVCGLETSSRTYIAEGFPCHNTKETTERKYATFNYKLGQHPDYIVTGITPTPRDRDRHPCEKHIKLIEWIISYLTKKNDIILDPFAGSSTTAVAALNLKRRFIMIEKDPKWVKISKQRLKPLLEQQRLEWDFR